MKMKLSFFLIWSAFIFSLPIQASIYQDSIKIENLLHKGASLPTDSCRTLFYGQAFLDKPYAAGTLETKGEERLVVCLDSLDCTTFVETVLAFVLTEQEHQLTYSAFIRNLTRIRYRNGVIDGYASRLHYFSDWVQDNESKGILHERSQELSHTSYPLTLSFMTSHPEAYPALKNNPNEIEKMHVIEAQWQDKPIFYIPKRRLNQSIQELSIQNGEILALTTSIKGLDVVHMGFACWIKGQLHLLHASSAKGKVILDSVSLYEYSKNKNAHTGIRVISVRAFSR